MASSNNTLAGYVPLGTKDDNSNAVEYEPEAKPVPSSSSPAPAVVVGVAQSVPPAPVRGPTTVVVAVDTTARVHPGWKRAFFILLAAFLALASFMAHKHCGMMMARRRGAEQHREWHARHGALADHPGEWHQHQAEAAHAHHRTHHHRGGGGGGGGEDSGGDWGLDWGDHRHPDLDLDHHAHDPEAGMCWKKCAAECHGPKPPTPVPAPSSATEQFKEGEEDVTTAERVKEEKEDEGEEASGGAVRRLLRTLTRRQRERMVSNGHKPKAHSAYKGKPAKGL